MARYYASVCKNTILSNLKNGTNNPPVRVSRGKYGRPRRYHSLIVPGPVKIMYDTNNPMPWGARVWLEWDA